MKGIAFVLGLLAALLILDSHGEPSETARFDCPGKAPFVAFRDPGAAWLNEHGQTVFPSAECKVTPVP